MRPRQTLLYLWKGAKGQLFTVKKIVGYIIVSLGIVGKMVFCHTGVKNCSLLEYNQLLTM